VAVAFVDLLDVPGAKGFQARPFSLLTSSAGSIYVFESTFSVILVLLAILTSFDLHEDGTLAHGIPLGVTRIMGAASRAAGAIRKRIMHVSIMEATAEG